MRLLPLVLLVAAVGIVFACSAVNNPDDPVEPTGSGGSTASGMGASSSTSTTTGGSPPGCGDGTLAGAEACDDGNSAPGDGCDAACAVEGSCAAPIEIVLMPQGNILQGGVMSAVGGVSQVDSAMCAPNAGGAGSDRIYRFELTDAARMRATLAGSFAKVVRLLTMPCDVASPVPNACGSGSGDLEVIVPALAAGTYYAVVDSESDETQTFDLLLEAGRPLSCTDILAGGLPDGPYTIDNGGGDLEVYCAGGVTYEAFGFGPFSGAFPGYQLLSIGDFQNSVVQAAFIWHYNTFGGFRNLGPAGWNSDNCCHRMAGSTGSLTFGPPVEMYRVYPANQDCTHNCSLGYADAIMRFDLSGVPCQPMLPANYFTTNPPQVAPACGGTTNPGFFVRRY